MKNFVFAMMAACSIFGASAQDLQGISLNSPSKQCGELSGCRYLCMYRKGCLFV